MEQYLEAYQILSHYRSFNGTLEFENVVQYAKLIGEDEPLEFVAVITQADRAFTQELKADRSLDVPNGQEEQGGP